MLFTSRKLCRANSSPQVTWLVVGPQGVTWLKATPIFCIISQADAGRNHTVCQGAAGFQGYPIAVGRIDGFLAALRFWHPERLPWAHLASGVGLTKPVARGEPQPLECSSLASALEGGSAAPALQGEDSGQHNRISGPAEKLSCPFQVPCPGSRRAMSWAMYLWPPLEYLPFCRGWEEAGAYSKRGPRRPAGQHSGATRPCCYRPSFLFRCSTHPEAQGPQQPSHANTAAPPPDIAGPLAAARAKRFCENFTYLRSHYLVA